ncbi:CshA/CshB family fibrillar adhesin-related protein [Stenotrophomonas maltophilia]|uniref:CshA/CshB family fibrillar adhesin-related protein n=1 Tax=Stenotrophomonas maltophilia TaxID=40324 RepID=UPI001F5372AA|nr:CshA/CshB family fibrillar adhesin-related protein [Stenotrophomonas maltophilia]MCI1058803.1 CshA/CshB family fibrillar adhesin-related protein [Stenotrophomonas maltophilia]MCI1062270.1 CshA/CshB family fibrillar adhesin-related protein [Stenotrophomonas maltophilia]MCI1079767.1 CshA/CshB family fibrillar adhesin-related protein [Stenotrophomonas maltophilia]MCI1082916.1 CshA/CshB family fibrillar adhesin-related protein [Stenotrophomonas maltophilia]MCI1095239.1 CshA/CshB family fibrilla
MKSRFGTGGAAIRDCAPHSRRFSDRWLGVCLLLFAMLFMPSTVMAAAYATGGSSPYRDTVLWLTWGGGELGTHNILLNNGDTSSFSMPVATGVNLDVTCGLSDISSGTLRSYRPGDYSGDSLDDLYNIGGTGSANRLIAGIARSSGTTNFRISCTSTLGGVPYRLPGLVMADAETLNNVNEHVEASAMGSWNVVELKKSIGSGAYRVTKSQNGTNNVIRFGPGNYQTAAVTFLSFDAGAYAPGDLSVNMDFAIRGGGSTAIAIGLLVPYADFGDAPASYGDAMHVVGALELRDDNIPDNTANLDINTAGYTPGGLAPPTKNYLGTVGPDTEQRSTYSADALGDDNFPAGNPNEEDTWPRNYRLTVMQAGTVVSQPVACVGNGSVAGWVDFNRNGQFDPSERSNTAVCSGGSAALSWTVPNDIEAGTTFVRLRYATDATQIQQPTGVADDGEVEDHLITIIAPSLRITKSNNSGDGTWNYGEAATTYTLTVSNTTDVPTGNPPYVAPGTITVLDDLPAGIVPGWSSTAIINGWSCAASGQRVTCTTNQVLGAVGNADASSSIVLPVTVTANATGTLTNYASVGGGHDPFNGGATPPPGAACVDADHCASNAVDVPVTRVGYDKRANTTGPVSVGDTISYTVDVTVADGDTRDVVTLTDTLGTGLDLGSVTSAGAFTCGVVNPLVCTLPAGTVPGTYAVTYSAVVNAQASGQVINTVVGTGTDNPVCTTSCTTNTPVGSPVVTVSKSTATTGPVVVGDSVNYTLTVVVANARTNGVVTLTDSLGAGLDMGTVTGAGVFTCNATNPLVCTLPAGTVPGSYAMSYTATVNAQASGQVRNAVVPSGPDTPTCGSNCDTTTTVAAPRVIVAKVSATAGPVAIGDGIQYTLSVTVADARTTGVVTLTDTLGHGLNFGNVTSVGAFTCNATNPLVCTLPAGTVPGTYTMSYTASVNAQANGPLRNAVVPSGPDTPICSGSCDTTTPLVGPEVGYSKLASTGGPLRVGDSLAYTLTVTVAKAPTTDVLTLNDTLGVGLDFAGVTSQGVFTCNAANPLVCSLPAGLVPGIYRVTYNATVNVQAIGQLRNTVVGSGTDTPICTGSCDTNTPLATPGVSYAKSVDTDGPVVVGDVLTYTLTAMVNNSQTTDALTLTDTQGVGLDFGSITSAGAYTCTAGNPLVCVLPAGSAPGSYAVSYTATVNDQASGQVTNAVLGSGNDNPSCAGNCDTNTPVEAPSIDYRKSTSTPGPVKVGDTIAYTLTAVVSSSRTIGLFTLTDTLGAGLDFGAVSATVGFTCGAANPLVCTLPASTVPGTYTVNYTATVNAKASGSVYNAVLGSGPGRQECSTNCSTTTDVVETAVSYQKSSSTAGPVSVGDNVDYLVEVTVANSQTTSVLTFTDTLGVGLDLPAVTQPGMFVCAIGNPLVCTLAAGTVPGVYPLHYRAQVNAQAVGSVRNAVLGSGADSPLCSTNCSTEHVVRETEIKVQKSSIPAAGTEVRAGESISYTLTVDVLNASTTQPLQLNDTLGNGLMFDAVNASGAFSCSASLVCTLPAGTAPGRYAVTYQAHVIADARGPIGNVVVGQGGGGQPPECTTCSTEHPLAEPRVVLDKQSDPVSGSTLRPGDRLRYTLGATVERAALRAALQLVDTPDVGLTIEILPAACAWQGGDIVCTLPAGTTPGRHEFSYEALVNAQARIEVSNRLRGQYPDGGPTPECVTCETRHLVEADFALRITKTANPRLVRVGDLIRYQLVVENVGGSNWRDGIVLDTPPPGFSYVAGSMVVADDDGAFALASSQSPLRISAMDIAVGRSATITYLLRVGAGVRAGVYVNEAVAHDTDGTALSNVATAEVRMDADPLLEDSLVFGTVFDDRDGDGWQDSAELTGVRVQGGFAPAAYIAGSTTIDRGQGPQPVADASAPLLHGMVIGTIAGRNSTSDTAEAHQVVVRQHLRELAFTGDFTLESAQGLQLQMDAQGGTSLQRSDDAAKGLTAAEPVVHREIARVADGYEVAYVIGNQGIQEQGIPGVRLATVEGLLIETDPFGRYHLADVHGGDARLGRNFIIKLDRATLPAGSELTTENPLLRRVTQGIPTRFSFGVRLPSAPQTASERAELTLGEVLFAPGSSELRAEHLPVLTKVSEVVDRYNGGDVVILADGESEALAFARATAVRDALQAEVAEASRAGMTVQLRTQVDDPHSMLVGLDVHGALLGTVLFETNKAVVREQFKPLMVAIARRLEANGGGQVSVVGHTDVRGSHTYNQALGLRRAEAVFEALRSELSPAVQQRVRVINQESAATRAAAGQQEARR